MKAARTVLRGAGGRKAARLPECAGHDAYAAQEGGVELVSESDPESDLGVRVPWRPWWQELLAEQQLRHREVSWEGSCRQSLGPRNTNRIRGVRLVGEGAKRPEARCHPDRAGVDAAGMWGEGHASYPGRSVRLPRG